ncbi:MAG: DUF4288 domain-containing protein [Clostridia bacterium]|nr:DUF4288 domain-containing protein [Clostridia bacterium]
MKNTYAVKCLYQSKFYSDNNELMEDVLPVWEERIVLIRATSMDEADLKSERIAKTYESDYVNENNQTVKVRLYAVVDIFAVFDSNAKTNIEVYSNTFSATEEDIEKILDIEY